MGPEQASPLWHRVWCLLLDHPWYQEQLRQCALRVVRAEKAPVDWVDDIEQDAAFLMGRSLRSSPTLHLPEKPATAQFASLLRVAILRHCSEALRSIRHKYLRSISYEALEEEPSSSRPAYIRIDFATTLDQLPEAQQMAIRMHLQRRTAAEIAAAMGITRSQAYRLVREAKATIQLRLRRSYGKEP